jgi:hypothetical protein
MRNWLKTVLFLSAFSPALLSIAISRYFAQGFFWSEVYYALAGISGIVIGACVMRFLRIYGETLTFKARKIEATDSAMLAVIATYIVPFIVRAPDITVMAVLCLTLLLAVVLWLTSALIDTADRWLAHDCTASVGCAAFGSAAARPACNRALAT